MKFIKLKLGKRSYKIIVGSHIIERLGGYIAELNIGKDAYVITNASVKKRYGDALNKALKKNGFRVRFKLVPDTEKSKSINTAYSVMKDLVLYDKKRRTFIVAFGGGVIGDLAGFIASIYKRGVPYIQVPTTLLAQVDSSIGGKTAVDLSEGKNLLGAFYQPRLVLSDTGFLKSLDAGQLKSGLAEVIKYGIIKDASFFAYLEKRYRDVLSLKPSVLAFIVKRSSDIKAKIIEKDEREEKGLRTILNFGHTIGHAIETAGNYRQYNHGQAIALGMLVASALSKKLGYINDSIKQRIENLIKSVGLPTRIKNIPLHRVIKAHYQDKKFKGAKNRFVLIQGIGKTRITEDVPLSLIKETIKNYSS